MVDDERGYAEGVVKEYLEKHDYDVRVETEGARCLAAAKEFRPDLILLDVMMRDRAGPQVASEVRADEALKGVPIIFVTATATVKTGPGLFGGELGGFPCIAKPVKLDKLREYLDQKFKA